MTARLLTDFEIMVLTAVLRVGDEAYGVPIAREIEATAKRQVQLPAVYAALDRLERQGLVRSRLGDPTPQRGGRAKKFFTLTPNGLRSVRETQQALTAMWTNVTALKWRDA